MKRQFLVISPVLSFFSFFFIFSQNSFGASLQADVTFVKFRSEVCQGKTKDLQSILLQNMENTPISIENIEIYYPSGSQIKPELFQIQAPSDFPLTLGPIGSASANTKVDILFSITPEIIAKSSIALDPQLCPRDLFEATVVVTFSLSGKTDRLYVGLQGDARSEPKITWILPETLPETSSLPDEKVVVFPYAFQPSPSRKTFAGQVVVQNNSGAPLKIKDVYLKPQVPNAGWSLSNDYYLYDVRREKLSLKELKEKPLSWLYSNLGITVQLDVPVLPGNHLYQAQLCILEDQHSQETCLSLQVRATEEDFAFTYNLLPKGSLRWPNFYPFPANQSDWFVSDSKGRFLFQEEQKVPKQPLLVTSSSLPSEEVLMSLYRLTPSIIENVKVSIQGEHAERFSVRIRNDQDHNNEFVLFLQYQHPPWTKQDPQEVNDTIQLVVSYQVNGQEKQIVIPQVHARAYGSFYPSDQSSSPLGATMNQSGCSLIATRQKQEGDLILLLVLLTLTGVMKKRSKEKIQTNQFYN